MQVMSVAKFERFFPAAGSLDIDKDDLKRYNDFVKGKIYDLLVRRQAAAKANRRDVIEPHDLPITNGLQKNLHRFRKMDEEIELQRRDRGATTRDRGRAERGPGPHLENHRALAKKPSRRAVGALHPYLRRATVILQGRPPAPKPTPQPST